MITTVGKILFVSAIVLILRPLTTLGQNVQPVATSLAKQQTETVDRRVRQAIAVDKSADEKNWYTQFLFAFPSGGTGTLSFNRTVYKTDPSRQSLLSQVNLEFAFGKGGGQKADPRYLDLGINFRKILLGSKRSAALKGLRASAPSSLLAAAPEANMFRSNARRIIREVDHLNRPQWFLNYASLHFETDLKKLKPGPVNNLLFSPSIEVRSRLMPVKNRCRSGSNNSDEESDEDCVPGPFFWSYRFIPFGVELGKNLRNKDNRAMQGDLISRLKTKTNLKLFYQSPCRYDTWFAGIMLEGDFTDRYLLTDESMFDRTTDLSDLIAKDNQYSLQVDLKFIMGLKLPEDLGKLIKPLKNVKFPRFGRRPSLTFSYRRGVVPPVFAFNNKFRVGLTFESLDDDNSRDLGSVVPKH